MATALHNSNSAHFPVEFIDPLRVAVVTTEWNYQITDRLLDGVLKYFKENGYPEDTTSVFRVPGSVELTFAANQLVKTNCYDAIIVIGCVIRGDTPHFDYVCESVTNGVATLNATTDVPVVFGVLTVENEEQALERAGGCLGNKGEEFAECAVKMVNFILKLKK